MKPFVKKFGRAGAVFALLVGVAVMTQETTQVAVAQPPAPAEEPVAPSARTFVGALEGAPEGTRVGIVCDDKGFIAYVCSEDKDFTAERAAWFKGAPANDKIEAANGERKLTAALTADAATGELRCGDKKFAFTAKRCDGHVIAGLYRAEADGAVYGWVIDEDGAVAGGVQRPNVKGTGPVPNNGVLSGVKTPVNANGKAVAGQKVQNPAAPPKGAPVKGFSEARRAEFLARVQAKTPQEGNPLLPALINTVRRFNDGAKPGNDVEKAMFAQLSKAPKQALKDYIKDWEKIPLAVRQRMAGPELAKMDAKTPLTGERLKELVEKVGVKPAAKLPRSNNQPAVAQVSVKTLRPLDTTGEVRDEIFAVYVVGTGNQLFTKTTSVLTGVKNGEDKNFPAGDRVIFPPPEQPGLVSFEDVLVTATLFEQDGNVALVANLVKVLVDSIIVGVAVATAPAGAGAAGFVAPANLLIDQIASAFPEAQTLDTDTFRATPAGQLLAIGNNNPKTELKFKTTQKKGPGPFDFRLIGLDAKKK